jgi:hypothetical protein
MSIENIHVEINSAKACKLAVFTTRLDKNALSMYKQAQTDYMRIA